MEGRFDERLMEIILQHVVEGDVPAHRPDLGPCWLWTGKIDQYTGYGILNLAGGLVTAHRLAYEVWIGPVPDGLVLDHLCRTRHCGNPQHTEPVTQQENILRGQGLAAQNARKTDCPAGHPYDADNTRIYNGRRHCRACDASRGRINRHAISAAKVGT
jgi:hypothetical protein